MKLQINKEDNNTFLIQIIEGNSITKHKVTLNDNVYKKLANNKISKEELIRISFEFLLERESKESILREFNLDLIGRYFPEYEEEIRNKINF